ncbi:DUF4041 domain-containing protein [Bradyrhizobium glycinis]|uniref:DUF4041 domain-containing protein n=1 Tax=Bradyrhizobium glycinis TaxID=2751812 RepID=UPI0018D5B5BF|nr:DUF4041 domain-containing protein [Bradyrhizobium glycinis]MBH5373262.1 DUF4041 domain-containing protein [Bradyrhizobium glycinis]
MSTTSKPSIPFFGARKLARRLLAEVAELQARLSAEEAKTQKLAEIARNLVADAKAIQAERDQALAQLNTLGGLPILELEQRKQEAQTEVARLDALITSSKEQIEAASRLVDAKHQEARQIVVETREAVILQEVGIYDYRHPLSDAVAYQQALDRLQASIKSATKRDGGAILATTDWTVNGSVQEGRKMVEDFSKLMLRAFNAEADTLVRGLKPYKLDSALERLRKVEDIIKRLGATMQIRISPAYYQLRVDELTLTADFLQKQAEEKEAERQERERLREERKAQQEMERERAKLEKEKQHYSNALATLEANGDLEGAQRLREQLADVDQAIESVDARAANIRAGYVYVISNIGSFGENMVKVGMTRRLDPMDRIKELSDASVPFNFDVHALFFSNDAVGIESAMHERLAALRVNTVNKRREFFRATPLQVKTHLNDLTGELLEFTEIAEALEYRQTLHGAHSMKPVAA